jgi:hypothetical protein
MEIKIDADELNGWARFYKEEAPSKAHIALSMALNSIGTTVVASVVSYIADQSGLDPDEIEDMVTVTEATPDNLVWEMDASRVAPPTLDWSRPWDTRDNQTNSAFDTNTLVNIITMEDELVCQKCQDAADNSPYTIEEAQALLPIHPNCRCPLQNYVSYQRLPVVFSDNGAAPLELLTPRGLAKTVATELRKALMDDMKMVLKEP